MSIKVKAATLLHSLCMQCLGGSSSSTIYWRTFVAQYSQSRGQTNLSASTVWGIAHFCFEALSGRPTSANFTRALASIDASDAGYDLYQKMWAAQQQVDNQQRLVAASAGTVTDGQTMTWISTGDVIQGQNGWATPLPMVGTPHTAERSQAIHQLIFALDNSNDNIAVPRISFANILIAENDYDGAAAYFAVGPTNEQTRLWLISRIFGAYTTSTQAAW